MRRAGLEVKTVGIGKAIATGSHNVTVSTDITLDEVCLENAQMVVLPGGPGHTLLCENERITALLKAANDKKIPIAAICASPSVIGRLGFLRGKRC
jgi:4-methyl-5(b-hydroxyethyl)-thiazole monophosphate biosynthesis